MSIEAESILSGTTFVKMPMFCVVFGGAVIKIGTDLYLGS